jgi:RNA polymerase sigma-70 factor (sigma-E family)
VYYGRDAMGRRMDETFEQYVARRGVALLRFAGALTGDRGTAEEIVQEVLLRASRRWPEIVATGAVPAYLRRMVINEHVSWRRKWARLVPHGDVPDRRIVADHAERQADRDALSRELDKLPPRQRAVLVLRYYEGLGDDAIAGVLGCSTGTVRSHASRALAALRIDLSPTLAATSTKAREK